MVGTHRVGALSVVCLMLGAAVVIFGSREASAGALADDELFAIAQDSLYVYTAGFTTSFGSGGEDVIVQQHSKAGQLMWTYTWGGAKDDCAYSITLDGGGNGWVYVTGYTRSFSGDNEDLDVFVLKLTQNGFLDNQFGNGLGFIIWGNQHYDDIGRGITLTNEGFKTIYVTGTTWGCSCPGDQPNIFILKINPAGINLWQNLNQWQAVIWDPFTNEDYGYSIACNYDNGEDPGDDRIYVTGYTEPVGNGIYDGVLLCYDDLGNPVTAGGFVNGYLLFGTANAFDYSYSLFYDPETDWLFMTGWTDIFGYYDLLYFSCDGQGQNQYITYWQHLPWEGEPANYGWSIWYDGTYIWLTGYSVSAQIGVDIFIAQCDLDGAPNTEAGWPMRYDYGFLWAEGFGITVDTANSRMYVAGWVYENSPGLGSYETFLGKFQTNDGSTVAGWPKTWSDSFDDYAMAIEVTDTAVYICGYTYGYGTIGKTDAFLAKYDLAGLLLWYRIWGGPASNDRAYAVGVTDTAVFIAGSTEIDNPNNLYDFFIMKYDLDGNPMAFGGGNNGYLSNIPANDEIFGMDIANGMLYFTGYWTQATNDFLLVDSDLNGGLVNAYSYNFPLPIIDGDEKAYSIAADGSNAYIAGYSFSNNLPGMVGAGDAILLKFNLNGQFRFQTANNKPVLSLVGGINLYGGAFFDCAYSVDIDNNNVYWAGDKQNQIQPPIGPPYASENSFVQKRQKNGAHVWTSCTTDLFDDVAYSLKVRENYIYVAGYEEKYGSGVEDAYLRKYDLAGNTMWQTYQNDPPYKGMILWSGISVDIGRAIAVTDNIYTAGWTWSTGPTGGCNGLLLKHTTDGVSSYYKLWG